MTVTEHELLLRARAGDRAARDEIVARYMPLARYVARHHAVEDRDDAVQDMALEVLDMIDRWDPSVGPDLRGLAPWRLHACVQSASRKRAVRQRAAERWALEAPRRAAPADTDPIAVAALRRALASLAARTRVCIVRVVVLDVRAADVAAQLRLHPASVRRIVREGMRSLAVAMGVA